MLVAARAAPTAGPARELIDLLTGGRIDLERAGERRAHRGRLRERFRYRLVEALTARLTGVAITGYAAPGADVVLEYRAEFEAVPADVVAAITAPYEAGTPEKQIARNLDLPRRTVTRVLNAWEGTGG